MSREPSVERRESPRYLARHPVQGTTPDGRQFQGYVCDMSMRGIRLQLGVQLLPNTPVTARCNIGGIGLRMRGQIVWAKPVGGGTLHGVAVTGFASDEDALFHRLYLARLSRQAATISK